MISFLTSSPTLEYSETCNEPALDPRNQLIQRLEEVWPHRAACLMIAAFPHDHSRNDEMTQFYQDAVTGAGLSVSRFDLWDDRQELQTMQTMLDQYQVVFLAGGHVPTENRWFHEIGLLQSLEHFEGIVVGTSAGSMNMAQLVYAWPEEPGESLLPVEQLFLPGLGLARVNVLPHLQKVRNWELDGRALVDDITREHSFGHRFLAIPDGSYVLVRDGQELVCGEAWLIAEGEITLFCSLEESRLFN